MAKKISSTSWHAKSVNEVYSALDTNPKGLSSAGASKRLKKYGKNVLKKAKDYTLLKIVRDQFKSALVIILIAATVISVAIGHFVDAAIIAAIVLVNAAFGFIQEYKAEKSMAALKKMAAPKALVIRNGKRKTIRSEGIVPGDIIVLGAGSRVPADARVIESTNLELGEAVLTGESAPVTKIAEKLGKKTPLGERANMVYSGTAVLKGHGLAVVVDTGMNTEFGKIAKLVQETKETKTPLQKKLANSAKYIGLGVVVVAAVIFGAGILRSIPVFDMFLNAIALAVAAVPEGLPAVVTITLAIGVKTMAKKKAIVRKLPVAETLGSATVICTDKTGTLTKNEMTATQLYADGKLIKVSGSGYAPKGKFTYRDSNFNVRKNKVTKKLLQVAELCNLSELHRKKGSWKITGDPTEAALLVAAKKAKFDMRRRYKKLGEISFTSKRKLMTTFHASRRKKFAATKGAPEIVLARCNRILVGGKIKRLTEKKKKKILDIKKDMTTDALRVLGLAYKPLKVSEVKKIRSGRADKKLEKNLIFVGLAGMIDPARPEVPKAIALCKKAGIKPVMVTGDDKDTALAIAKDIGLHGGGHAMLGEAVENMSTSELAKVIDDVDVFARVSPQHKLNIVAALRKRGHIIAMTGDGVNDAPALKEADIGVAMGIKGTDVSQEASDIVLEDDNFSTIVTAVKEGRRIYSNIKKFVRYLLSCNVGEVLVIFLAALIGLPLPLIAVQILLMNLLTDGLPALALGVDPAAEDVMEQKPRDPKSHIIDWPMIRTIAVIGAFVTAGVLGLFSWSLASGHSVDAARSVAFTGIVAFQMFYAFNSRAETKSLFKSGVPSGWLFAAVASSILIQLAVVYLPAFQGLFGTAAISASWLGRIGLVAASIFAVAEVEKLVARRVGKS